MSEIHGASGSYVLNALDPAEKADFEAHLAQCETCQREVAEFRETVGELASMSAASPPPDLKAHVMGAISGVRVLPPREPSPAPSAPSAPDELALRRQRRTIRALTLAVAAVLVVAVGLGGWVLVLSRQQAPSASTTREGQLLAAPDLTAYTVDLKDGGTGTILVSKSRDQALFTSGDLPALSGGRTFQLWTLSGPLSAPTRVSPDALVSGGGVVRQWFTGPISDSDAVAISIEEAGGASAPTDVQAATTL